MFASWKIARLFNIDVRLHWTFWLLPLWVVLTFNDQSPLPMWAMVLLIVPLFTSIVMHEYGHALMARYFGIGTKNITLSPLGGIAQLERMSNKPWEEFWIAIAGPCVNVVIAAVLGVALLGYALLDPLFSQQLAWQFFGLVFVANIVFVLFNMIPAFPMDGGRVLRALLSAGFGLLRGTRIAVAVGTFMAVFMGAAGALWLGNPWLILIALFVIWAGHQELMALEMEARDREESALNGKAAMHVTLCLWDPQRRAWVRHSYFEPRDRAAA
jgi:Zn-dependent protease